jgi:hypothetical protein
MLFVLSCSALEKVTLHLHKQIWGTNPVLILAKKGKGQTQSYTSQKKGFNPTKGQTQSYTSQKKDLTLQRAKPNPTQAKKKGFNPTLN